MNIEAFKTLKNLGIKKFYLISDDCFYYVYNNQAWRVEQLSSHWDAHIVPWVGY